MALHQYVIQELFIIIIILYHTVSLRSKGQNLSARILNINALN